MNHELVRVQLLSSDNNRLKSSDFNYYNWISKSPMQVKLLKITSTFNQLKFINQLGYCYRYGIKVEKDENKAFNYLKSAEMNNSKYIKLVIVMI